MKSSLSLLHVWGFLCASSLAFACSGETEEDEEEELVNLEDPTLEISGATTTDGVFHDRKDGEIILACDPRLTVHVGPSDVRGHLDNWLLRPPGTCGASKQCGYLRLALLDEEGEELLITESPLIDVVLELGDQDLSAASALHVTLIQGESLEPFLVQARPVEAEWPVQLSLPEACSVAAPEEQG